MIKHLTKHGNSMAMVIEKPILELIGVDADTPFEITTDGHALILTPMKPEEDRKTFDALLERVNTRYGRALRKLAE
jgi:antitoxin component of MazEF toxin-antitoxin module